MMLPNKAAYAEVPTIITTMAPNLSILVYGVISPNPIPVIEPAAQKIAEKYIS